jgi:hypothetical protein
MGSYLKTRKGGRRIKKSHNKRKTHKMCKHRNHKQKVNWSTKQNALYNDVCAHSLHQRRRDAIEKTRKRKTHRRKRRRRKTHRRRTRRRNHRGGAYPPPAGGWSSGWKAPAGGPVGYPWKASPSSWPGVAAAGDGISPGLNTNGTTVSNHYPISSCGIPAGPCNPPNSTRNQDGGGGLSQLLPQDLVNLGRSLTGGVMGSVDSWRGVSRPASTYPLPTQQQPIDQNVKYISKPFPDINQIHTDAGTSVSKM